jgi:hypothetical protein
VFKGIHRGHASDTSLPRLAWVSDGMTGFKIPEEEYRRRGYEPEFDALPLLNVRRVPVSDTVHEEMCDDDREFIEEYMRKNATRT